MMYRSSLLSWSLLIITLLFVVSCGDEDQSTETPVDISTDISSVEGEEEVEIDQKNILYFLNKLPSSLFDSTIAPLSGEVLTNLAKTGEAESWKIVDRTEKKLTIKDQAGSSELRLFMLEEENEVPTFLSCWMDETGTSLSCVQEDLNGSLREVPLISGVKAKDFFSPATYFEGIEAYDEKLQYSVVGTGTAIRAELKGLPYDKLVENNVILRWNGSSYKVEKMGKSLSKIDREQNNLYAWVDRINIRQLPDVKSPIVANARKDELLKINGGRTDDTEMIVVRGVAYEDYWYSVLTKNQVEGWVFGGVVKRKDEEKGNGAINTREFDFPYFGKENLRSWKRLSSSGGVLTYQKGNLFLEIYRSPQRESGYRRSYKLMDADKKVLKEREFSFETDPVFVANEEVIDHTVSPAKRFSRFQRFDRHYFDLNNLPEMANTEWKVEVVK